MKVSDASQSNNPIIKRAVKKYLFQQNYQKSIDKYIELENNETTLMIETSSRYIPSIDKKYTALTDCVSENNLDDSSVCEFKEDVIDFRKKIFESLGFNGDECVLKDETLTGLTPFEDILSYYSNDVHIEECDYQGLLYQKLLKINNDVNKYFK